MPPTPVLGKIRDLSSTLIIVVVVEVTRETMVGRIFQALQGFYPFGALTSTSVDRKCCINWIDTDEKFGSSSIVIAGRWQQQ